MYIKKRYQQNLLKNIFSFLTIVGFSYLMINSDKFQVEDRREVVRAYEYGIEKTNNNWSISLEEHIIFEEWYDKFIYIVQPNDNLSKIAYLFWTTSENIKKVNNLTSKNPVLKPWQKLTISQEEGIIFEVNKDTNLKQFAKQYWLHPDLVTAIIWLNYLSDENYEFMKWEEIFIPINEEEAKKVWLKTVVIKPKPVPVQTAPWKKVTKNNKSSTPAITYDKSSKTLTQWHYSKNIQNGFYRWHCTRYVAIKKFPYSSASKQSRLWWGNANAWYANAKAAWYSVWKDPQKWSIVVLKNWWANFYSYWHVWIVLDIDWKNKKLLIEDMNAKWRFIVTQRWISMNSSIIWYIYL